MAAKAKYMKKCHILAEMTTRNAPKPEQMKAWEKPGNYRKLLFNILFYYYYCY